MRRVVFFDEGALDRARREHGLTNDQVVEQLGVSETTWMRWKRENAVPIERVTDVVLLLGLDEPEGMAEDVPRTPWVILRGIEGVLAGLHRIEERLPRAPDEPQSG